MLRRGLAAATVVLVATLGWAGAAFAHVTVDPASAPKGGEITLGFRVPNEESKATTTEVQIFFPGDHPILGVDPEVVPGWHDTITTAHLAKPIVTDDGPVSEYVSEITWSGGSIPVGHFQEFYVLAQNLPTDTNQLVFKALQTYSDGTVVRWIDPVVPGHLDPDHPTPILELTGPKATTPTTPASNRPSALTATGTKAASDTGARTLGIVGIVLGGLALLVGGASLFAVRRRDHGTHRVADTVVGADPPPTSG